MIQERLYKELKTTEQIVKDILEKHPNTRDDDFKLYAWVLYYNGINIDQSVRHFLGTAKQNGVPPFATVTKCRRTLQGVYPQLMGTNKEARAEAQGAYRTYNWENK